MQQENTLADDLVVGSILFENGIVFNGSWCFSISEKDEIDNCTIYGSKGNINFPIFGNKIKTSIDGFEKEYNFESLKHVQQPMIEQVVNYFLGNGPNPCSGEDALITMELLDCQLLQWVLALLIELK